MLNILTKLILVCFIVLSVQANVTSLSPKKDATNVPADINIQITFDNPIVSSSLKKNTIKLKTDNKKIKGELSVKDSNTLIFSPNENLKTGKYSLHVKSIKLKNPKPIKPKTWFQKIIYKICSFFYSDVRECKLYNLFFGNNDIKTQSIKYSFSVNDNIATIETLNLETSLIELKENTQANLTLKATYTDGTIKDITENIQWTIQDNSIITINNNKLEALKEGTTTLQAKVDNTTSNTISITVYKEINGYKLPPQPDETLNNSTLLGIDSNGNGVRDDVERKIYFKYKKPVIQAFMMQSAKSYPKILDNPVAAAKSQETQDDEWNESSCAGYIEDFKSIEMPGIEGIEFLSNSYMNTKERIRAYIEFNEASSGGSYSIPIHDKDLKEENCDFNVEEMLELGK